MSTAGELLEVGHGRRLAIELARRPADGCRSGVILAARGDQQGPPCGVRGIDPRGRAGHEVGHRRFEQRLPRRWDRPALAGSIATPAAARLWPRSRWAM